MSTSGNKFGVVVTRDHTFSNGMNQNALFLYMLTKNLGFECHLLSYDETQKQIMYENIPVKHLSSDSSKFDSNEYKVIFVVGSGLYTDIYNKCKKSKTLVIRYVCSNQLCMAIEGVATDHKVSHIVGSETHDAPIDRAWVLDSFPFMKTYIELMRGVKSQYVPHLWNSCLIEYYCTHINKKDPALLVYNPEIHTQKKITIIITEPNINFVKTAVVPLLAAEKLYTLKPELIDEIFVFSSPMESKTFEDLVKNLKVGKKVRKFERKLISEIMLHFNECNAVPVFVSNQIYTPLNYTYYETMYYGFPFVHNSPLLKDYGNYYPDLDIDLAAVQIMKAYTSHADVSARLAKNRAYLEAIDPNNMKCILGWKDTFGDI
jgi:hypothetical protein